MGPAGARLGGSIRPRRSSRGAVRKLAARPLVALVPTADPEGPGGHSPRAVGPRGWPKARPRADSRSAGPLAAGAGLGETRADPPVHSLRTALGSDRPLGGPTQSPVRTLQSERLALGSADANGTNRSDRRPAGRHAPMPASRMDVVVARSRARVRRAEVDPRRRLKPTTTAPLGCSRSVRLRWGTRCTAAMSAALRCTRCDRLHRAVVGCNGLWSVATGCHAVQQVVTRCNRSCTLCCDHAALAATGCTGLRSVAKGCARLQRTALRCNRVR